MIIVRYFLLFILVVLFTILIILLIDPGLTDSIPNKYKSAEYLNLLDKIIIPLGSIITVVILVLTYLIQLEEKNHCEKNINHRELKILLKIIKIKEKKDWFYALKIEIINVSIPNIYLSHVFISYFRHSEPDSNEIKTSSPLRIKLEHGQIEEKILKLKPLVSNEIDNGYLMVKIIITDSLGKEYICDEIKFNNVQKEYNYNLILDKS